MSWDVPTELDCPECGNTLFKKSGRGRMKPFCINEKCVNFLPEDKRGYYKKNAEKAEDKPAKKSAKKTTAAKKTTKTKKKTEAGA